MFPVTGSDSERDLFADAESEDEARDARYDEFFDPPSDGMEDGTESDGANSDGEEDDGDVANSDGEEDDGDVANSDGEEGDGDPANSDGEVIGVKSGEEKRQLSTHEKRQLKVCLSSLACYPGDNAMYSLPPTSCNDTFPLWRPPT